MHIPIIKSDNILTLVRPAGSLLTLNIGDMVTARVLQVMENSNVLLRITPNNTDGFNINAKSNITLTNGDIVRLKVLGGDKEIQLQFAGKLHNAAPSLNQANKYTPDRIYEILSHLSASKLKSSDIRLLNRVISSLPDTIKNAFPEFKAIEHLMPEITKISSLLLKTAVHEAGVIFETRLKFALLQNKQHNESVGEEILSRISSLESDQKLLLMKIKEALNNDELTGILKSSGFKTSDIAGTVDKLLKNIEFFQLTSYLNSVLYTFLPVSWQELIDGEILFRKNETSEEISYSCDINVDLEPIGKLSIGVTFFKSDFYITFQAEKTETITLINSERQLIENGFLNAGLSLKIINTSRLNEFNLDPSRKKGVSVRA